MLQNNSIGLPQMSIFHSVEKASINYILVRFFTTIRLKVKGYICIETTVNIFHIIHFNWNLMKYEKENFDNFSFFSNRSIINWLQVNLIIFNALTIIKTNCNWFIIEQIAKNAKLSKCSISRFQSFSLKSILNVEIGWLSTLSLCFTDWKSWRLM